MRRVALLFVPLAAACGPKAPADEAAAPAPSPVAIASIPADELTESERARLARSGTPAPAATPASSIAVVGVSEDELPAKATLLWKAEQPLDVPKDKILAKEGVLKKVAPPEDVADSVRYYPYAIDYWGITRTDLAALLEKNVGKPVRVKGHYRKIFNDGTWTYEVDPVSIVLLPSLP